MIQSIFQSYLKGKRRKTLFIYLFILMLLCKCPDLVIWIIIVIASRGVACVFAARKRALVYILEEDEDEVSDAE
jgi:chromate transport protein ChrA